MWMETLQFTRGFELTSKLYCLRVVEKSMQLGDRENFCGVSNPASAKYALDSASEPPVVPAI